MPDLFPVPDHDVDPRIARHLEAGETLLWRGRPRKNTFVRPGALLARAFGGFFGIVAPLDGLDGLVILPDAPRRA